MDKLKEKGKEVLSKSKSVLSKSKLNVVGEVHATSSQRRDDEKVFCLEKTDSSSYWLENEFEDKDTGEPADSWYLTMLQCISVIQTNIAKINDTSTIDVTPYYNDLKEWLKKLINKYSDVPRTEPKIKDLERYINFLNHISNNNLLSKDRPDILEETRHHIDNISRICNEKESGLPSDMAGLSKTRSRHMHNAAQKKKNVKGVWKVGERHINEIRGISNNNIEYKLIPEKEFSDEYSDWRRSRNA